MAVACLCLPRAYLFEDTNKGGPGFAQQNRKARRQLQSFQELLDGMTSPYEAQVHPVILSGGSGSRLWPLSREHYPKQLIALMGELTLLQQTVVRLDGLTGAADPLVVCNDEHRFLVAEQLRQMGRNPAGILLEPFGRNTAPALTLAALAITENNGDGVMLAMPADHVIEDGAAFRGAVERALDLARARNLITFGIVPAAAETGYGYIEKGDAIAGRSSAREPMDCAANSLSAHRVKSFVEKPDVLTAERYAHSGAYLWNSGMFMMLASVWLKELTCYRPDIVAACTEAFRQGTRDSDFFRVGKEAFDRCPSDSIDYAVMEKTDRAVVVPLEAGWSDVGAWSSLWKVGRQDADGNVIQGDVLAHDTRNALVIAQHRLVATVGLNNVVVVETADAVLVADKDHSQHVKEVVNRLKQEKREEHKSHRKVYRPWGYYEGVDAGPRFQVKRIMVNAGAALSLQMHHHRAEHWIIVKGTARITRGDEVFILTENQSTYIPLGTKHRLENPGAIPLEMIEVQSGAYLGEDDIVRFEDQYNRIDK